MSAGLRVRSSKAAPTPLWIPSHLKHGVYLPVPDPITFVTGEQWLDRPLYPRQATMIKIVFLRDDLLTEYDYRVIEEWEQSWAATGDNGTPPRLVERMKFLKALGHKWFRELILVLGRRAGKGYISALCMAYVLWNYMAKYDPQLAYRVDRDKQLTCLIYAGRKDQAKANLWRDLVNVIQGAACFQPYVSKPMGESLSVYAPADIAKREKLAAAGIVSGLDAATFRIDPQPATPGSGRGGAGFMLGFDEMAHMINAGANRSSDEVWNAAKPSLAQFKKDAFVVCPSSPWQEIGQFYIEWELAQEINPDTGDYAYPYIFMLQLESWATYLDWEIADQIELFPEEFIGDLKEYQAVELPRLPHYSKAVLTYDDVEHEERADPDNFNVEYRSKWQATLDAYLNPQKIRDMFDNEPELVMTDRGILSQYYKAHGDPGFVNDPFGFAVAHTVTDADGYEHVIFDLIKQWDPRRSPDNIVNILDVQEEIAGYMRSFPLDDLSFDQHNSRQMTAELDAFSRTMGLPKRCGVHIITETAPYNLKIAETFKVALNQGWIHAPYFEIAEQELRFLQFVNGKVKHQDIGPVQHDDVARAMMEVVYALLEQQVVQFRFQGTSLSAAMSGGSKPFMHPTDGHDIDVIGQFSQARRTRTGGGAGFQVSRGKPGFVTGRGPLPRTPTRRKF